MRAVTIVQMATPSFAMEAPALLMSLVTLLDAPRNSAGAKPPALTAQLVINRECSVTATEMYLISKYAAR